jgi:hypothetical protein
MLDAFIPSHKDGIIACAAARAAIAKARGSEPFDGEATPRSPLSREDTEKRGQDARGD